MAAAGPSDPTSKPDTLVRVAPDADFSNTEITVQEAFLLSRVDGKSSVKTLCLLSGMGEDTTRELLLSLWKKGLIVVGNRKAMPAETTKATITTPSKDSAATAKSSDTQMDVIDSILLRHGGELPNEEEVAAEEVPPDDPGA